MEMFGKLVERWVKEFSRAIEMFTGEKAEVSPAGAAAELSSDDIAERTWWKQVAEGESSFSLWAGANESMWTALGEGPEAQSSFFEMLSQANQGTVAVLSSGFAAPWRCQDGVAEAPALPLNAVSMQINVSFRGADAGQILLLVDKKALALLSREEDDRSSAGSRESIAGISASPAMLSRLMDLQLPVSVLLGRATITIKDALKLMSGSVIELDRTVGDYVEIVVHGTTVAKGEIVSVKGNYGVRIVEVISRQDRMALHKAA